MADNLLDVDYDRINNRFYSDGPIDKRYRHQFVLTDTSVVSGSSAISNLIALTQAQYDAIASKDPSTLYVITP